jgi:hypothetical protein
MSTPVDEAKEKLIEENWLNWCYECKHAYQRKDDTDYMYCRLRKRPCPHLAEYEEKEEWEKFVQTTDLK